MSELMLTDRRRKDPNAPMPFVSAKKLALAIGCNEKAIPLLEKQGLLTVRQLPGGIGAKTYRLADAEKIKRLMIRPAVDDQEQDEKQEGKRAARRQAK